MAGRRHSCRTLTRSASTRTVCTRSRVRRHHGRLAGRRVRCVDGSVASDRRCSVRRSGGHAHRARGDASGCAGHEWSPVRQSSGSDWSS